MAQCTFPARWYQWRYQWQPSTDLQLPVFCFKHTFVWCQMPGKLTQHDTAAPSWSYFCHRILSFLCYDHHILQWLPELFGCKSGDIKINANHCRRENGILFSFSAASILWIFRKCVPLCARSGDNAGGDTGTMAPLVLHWWCRAVVTLFRLPAAVGLTLKWQSTHSDILQEKTIN